MDPQSSHSQFTTWKWDPTKLEQPAPQIDLKHPHPTLTLMLVFFDLLLPQPSVPMVDATAKLAGAGVELRLLSGVLCDRRAKLFLYGFLFAFVACTAYLAFNPDIPAAASPFFARFFSPYAPSSAVSGAADSPLLLQLPSVSPSPALPPAVAPATAVVSSGATVSNFSAKLMSMNVTKPAASPRGSTDRNETAAVVGRREVKNATAKAGLSQTSFNQSRHGGDGDGVNATGSGRDSGRIERGVALETMKRCDLYDGRWVKDESYPLYQEGSCPLIDEQYDCFQNGRRDKNYLKYRWQPNGCNIPR